MSTDDESEIEPGSLPHAMESSRHRVFGNIRVSHEQFRFLYAAEHVYLAGLLLHTVFLGVFFALDIRELYLFNIASVAVFILAFFLNRNGHHYVALWLAYLEVNIHAGLAIWLLGWSSGFYYYMFAIGPMLFINPLRPLFEKIVLAILPVIFLILLFFHSVETPAMYQLDNLVVHFLHISNLIATVMVVAYLAHYYSKGVLDSERRLQKLTRDYEQLATYDSLTHLLNRHAMNQAIEDEVSRFRRDGKPFVLALGDIDDFKLINDRYGHHAGDVLLKELASRMLQRLRRHDVISRWGGEEFLLLLADIDLDEAEAVLNELRNALAEPIRIKNLKHSVTITFGAAQYSDEQGIEQTIQAADRAMYRGKRAGKDRVVLVTSPTVKDQNRSSKEQ